MLPPDRLVKGGVLLLPCVGDGRQSGTSASPSILNASPEAAVGGGLALLKTGDKVRVDIGKRRADILISDDELAERKAAWKPQRQGEPDALAGAAAQVRRPARERRLPRLRGRTTRRSPRPRACRGTPTDRSWLEARHSSGASWSDLPGAGSRASEGAAARQRSNALTEQPLLDGDRQVGAIDQDDGPRRGRLSDRARGRRRRGEVGAGAGRREARGGAAEIRGPPATGRGAAGLARWAIMISGGMRSSNTTTMRSRRRLVDRMLTE